jgi:hypothetical protein
MSKREDLRKKFSNIPETTFNRLFDGDKTPTKKYAEFLISAWFKKGSTYGGLKSVDNYIELVDNFELFLPRVNYS